MVIEKNIGQNGIFGKLTYLFLYDDSIRWKGFLIIIAVGVITGSVSDNSSDGGMFEMNIAMFITALLLFAGYSIFRNKALSVRTVNWRKPMVFAGLACSSAVAFSVFSFIYQKNSLNKDFRFAIETRDYARAGVVAQKALTVSEPLYTQFVKQVDLSLDDALREPQSWHGVLESLNEVSQTSPVPTATFKVTTGSLAMERGSKVSNVTMDLSDPSSTAFTLAEKVFPPSVPPPLIENVIVKGGQQGLDGFDWKGVTFVGTRISYLGSPVSLEDVRFVNCTFDLPRTQRGAKLAEYVALSLPKLEIGPEAS
jgi:hypothetical protein